MLIVGLTGGIGSGKSTASKEFIKLGADVIDADKIGRELLNSDTLLKQKIIDYFGEEIVCTIDDKRWIDRKKLAGIVFSDKNKLEKLNSLMHLPIIDRIKNEIKAVKGLGEKKIIIIEAPLLFEAGIETLMDIIIVIKAPLLMQIERIKKRDGLNKKEILAIMKNQWPVRKKEKYADYVVDNSKDEGKLKKDIKNIWNKLIDEKNQGGSVL